MSAKILLVEDDASYAKIARLALQSEGWSVESAGDAEAAVILLESGDTFDVVVTDIKLPGKSGVELLEWINSNIDPAPSVILMTAFATVQTAVSAMKNGAADYLAKPFSNDALSLAVSRTLKLKRLEDENLHLRQALVYSSDFENITGKSLPMQELFDLMRKASARDVSVLIRGESGTGKELVARAIHFAGNRRDAPFVPIDSAAIPENLLESELFGHVKGAFTGANKEMRGKIRSAHGGTIFFDEIGDMRPDLQAKLLRVLQERVVTPLGSDVSYQVDVRVIAATHVNLEEAIRESRFREDLFYRLNVLSLRVPPLRERKDDIPLLAARFVSEAMPDAKIKISDEAMRAMERHSWPGNVRELKNAIERAVVVADERDNIMPAHLPESILSNTVCGTSRTFCLPAEGVNLEELERDLIAQALERSEGNQTRAAMLLGISRNTLIYRIEKHGLPK